MNTLEAIAARRSIRKFQDTPMSEDMVRTILTAATLAPSGGNGQPWRFVVVQGETRAHMVQLMRQGIARAKARGEDLGSSEGSARVMEQAPVTIFVFNPYGGDRLDHVQSIGAAIENMCLAALDLGLGSLWICDVFYAQEELTGWLAEPGQMCAAVSFGYPAESPAARPRKSVAEVARWM